MLHYNQGGPIEPKNAVSISMSAGSVEMSVFFPSNSDKLTTGTLGFKFFFLYDKYNYDLL